MKTKSSRITSLEISRKFILATGIAALLVSLAPQKASSAAAAWNLPTGGEWNLAGNWNPAVIPTGVNSSSNDVFVTLGNVLTGHAAITVNAAALIETLTLDSIHNYTLTDSDLQFANATGRALTVNVGNLGDHAISTSFSGTANFGVTNNSGLGSLTLGPLTGTSPSTTTYSGVGKTSLTGTGWFTGTTMAISAGANVSIDNIAQVAATTLTIAPTATSGTFADVTTFETRANVDLTGKTVTIGGAAGANRRIRFTGAGDLNLATGVTVTTSGASNNFLNEGTGTVTLTGATLGGAANSASVVFESGKFSIGNLNTSGAGTTNRFVISGGEVKFTGTVTAAANTAGFALREGKFTADYTGSAAAKFANANQFQTGGTEVVFLGNDSAPVTETLGAPLRIGSASLVDGGHGNVSVVSGNNQNITVNLGALSRGSNGTNLPTANFATTNVGSGVATIGVTATNTNNILGVWATWHGTTYAINDGANVMAGLTTFTRTDQLGNLNTENVTLDLANATTFTSATAVTAQVVRISNAGTLDLGTRSFAGSILLSATAGTADTTITTTNASFAPAVIMQHNAAGRLILGAAISGALTKGGEGTLRLNATSTANVSVAINSGTIELGADNALGIGTISLRDQSGTGGFVATGSDRIIANSTALSTTQNNATFRGARFSGSNNLTVTGTWQAGDTTGSGAPPNRLTIDMAASKSANFGSASNQTGTFVLADTNAGTLLIDGAGAGDLRFFTPVQGQPGSGTYGGTVVVDRPAGLTIFDKSGGHGTLQVLEGVAVVKDSTVAAAVTKSVSVAGSGNSFDVSDPSGIVVGQAVSVPTGVAIGSFVTAISGNMITLSKPTTVATGTNNIIFRPLGTAGQNAAHVENKGVLSLGTNIAAPALTATSRGTLAINTAGYTQSINQATLGNGAMFLGSADVSGTADTSLVNGTITGGTLTPGALSTYRLGGGGGTLDIQSTDYLTGSSSVVIGDADLFKASTSTVKLTNGQNYTGPTAVREGTLEVVGAISGTTSVSITGGTLLLGASNRINDAAPVTLAGGKLSTGGFDEGDVSTLTAGLGSLTLSATSTLDFGDALGGGSQLLFAGVGAHTGGTLNILDWNGNEAGGGATDDRLLFLGSVSDFTTAFPHQSDVSFAGYGPGYATISFTGGYEIVPVPEPSSTALIGAAGLIGLIGFRERRRFLSAKRG